MTLSLVLLLTAPVALATVAGTPDAPTSVTVDSPSAILVGGYSGFFGVRGGFEDIPDTSAFALVPTAMPFCSSASDARVVLNVVQPEDLDRAGRRRQVKRTGDPHAPLVLLAVLPTMEQHITGTCFVMDLLGQILALKYDLVASDNVGVDGLDLQPL